MLSTEYDIDGDGVFGVPVAAQAILAPGQFVGQRATAKLPIPPSASISAYHEVNDRWAVMGDLTWTGWSTFEEFRVNFAFPSQPADVLRTEWNNVFRLSGGATYAWNERLTLRSGLAFDESPISTAFRGPGVPDSDRIVVALGAGYKLRDNLTIDAGYQHLFFSGRIYQPTKWYRRSYARGVQDRRRRDRGWCDLVVLNEANEPRRISASPDYLVVITQTPSHVSSGGFSM